MRDKQTADLLFQQEKYQDAYIIYKQIYNTQGTKNSRATLLKCMAQCQHRLNNTDKAESYYRKSLKTNTGLKIELIPK